MNTLSSQPGLAVGWIGAFGARIVLASLVLLSAATATGQPVPACGDANADGSNSATDAAIALRTGVGAGACPLCLCDVNLSGAVNATDGLLILQFGVGQSVALACSACAPSCTPKNLTGIWDFRLDEVSESCGDGLDPPLITRLLLEEDEAGNVVIVSPTLPRVFNIAIQRGLCSAEISFDARTDEAGALRHYTGTLELGEDGDSFRGDLVWELCNFLGCPSCGGTDLWTATRR